MQVLGILFSLIMPMAVSPSVSILLPADIPAETIQISDLMEGPFGGAGGLVEPQPSQHTIRIDASYEGQAAKRIKIIVYAPGCDFMTFDLSLLENPNPVESFVCKALPKVSLSGQLPSELIGEHSAELVVHYDADWACTFFKMGDCIVNTFLVTTVLPARDGRFYAELPDFSAAAGWSSFMSDSDFDLILRDSKTWNHLAQSLTPELLEFRATSSSRLKIQPSYPAGLKFIEGNIRWHID